LELYKDGTTQSEIVRMVGITQQAVAKTTITIAKKEEQALRSKEETLRYQCIIDDKLEECNAAAGKENPEWTTKLAETMKVRDITEKELMMHTYLHTLSGSEPEVEKTESGQTMVARETNRFSSWHKITTDSLYFQPRTTL
jgi:hypothetical protein